MNNSESVVDFDELQKMLSDLASGFNHDIEIATKAATPPTSPPIGRANTQQPPAATTTTTTGQSSQPIQNVSTPPLTPDLRSSLSSSSNSNLTSSTSTLTSSTSTLTSSRLSNMPTLQKEISLDALRQVHENSPLHRVEKPFQRKINPLPRLVLTGGTDGDEDTNTATGNELDDHSDSSDSDSSSSDSSDSESSHPVTPHGYNDSEDPDSPIVRPRATSHHHVVQQMDQQLRSSGIRLSSVLDLSSSRLPHQRAGSIRAMMHDSTEEEYQLQQEFEEQERRQSVASQSEAQRRLSVVSQHEGNNRLSVPPSYIPKSISTSSIRSSSSAGNLMDMTNSSIAPAPLVTTTPPPSTQQDQEQQRTIKLREEVLSQLGDLAKSSNSVNNTSNGEGNGNSQISVSISESTRNLIVQAKDLDISMSTLKPNISGNRIRTESIAERWDLGRQPLQPSSLQPLNLPAPSTTPPPPSTTPPPPEPTPSIQLPSTMTEREPAPRRSQSLNMQRVGEEFNIYRANPLKKPNPEMEKLLVHISLVDHSHKVICITEDFFVQDIINLFAEKLGLAQTEYFSLCECTTDGYDRWLDPSKLIRDAGIRNLSKLIFKIKYFKQPKRLSDPKAVHLYYLQIQQGVVSGIYPCSEAMAFRLAALQFYITFGAHDKEQHIAGFLDHETLIGFVPAQHFHMHSDEYIQRRLFRLHSQIKCNGVIEAKLRYLDLSNKIPTFGVTAFEVFDASRESSSHRIPRILCVAENGLLIARKDNNGYDFFQYKEIINCQSTPRGVKIQIPFSSTTQNTSEVMNFDTTSYEQSNNIIELLAGYKYFIQYEDSLKGLCKPPSVDLHLASQFSLFLPPKQRSKSDPLRSRAELFKTIYLQLCTTFNTKPIMKFIDQIDDILDKEGSFRNLLLYTTVDLSSLNMKAADLSFIADALRDTYNTPILEGETIVENLSLVSLDLSNNPLLCGTTDVAEPFKILLQAARSIVNINIKNIGITNKVLGPFISIFEKLENIKSLQVGKNRLYEVGVNAIIKAIKPSQIESLSIEETHLLDEGCNTIKKLLSKRKSLISLNISKNKITENGFKNIFEGLQYNTTLKDLNISGNPITYKQINKFLKWFASSNTSIEKLSIASTGLNSSSGPEIQKILSSNGCHIQQLDVSLNNLGSSGTKYVIRGIATNNTITDLSLSGNPINNSGINSLCQSLETTVNLSKISLRYCNLASKSLYRICKMLETNSTITSLDLSMNKFSKSVCTTLSQCLSANKKLEELFITSCEMGDKEFAKLCVGLELNESLKRIYLDMNPFGKKGLGPLVNVVNNNKVIEVITLRNVNLNTKHTLEFLKKLNTNSTIQKINLVENPIFAIEKINVALKHGIEENVKRLNRIHIQI